MKPSTLISLFVKIICIAGFEWFWSIIAPLWTIYLLWNEKVRNNFDDLNFDSW